MVIKTMNEIYGVLEVGECKEKNEIEKEEGRAGGTGRGGCNLVGGKEALTQKGTCDHKLEGGARSSREI